MGPVAIEFSIDVSDLTQLSRLRFQLSDRRSLAWSAQAWAGPEFLEARIEANSGPTALTAAGRNLETTEFQSLMKALNENVMYIPAYRNLINAGGAAYYDITVGQNFVQMWDGWQGSDLKENREAIIEVVSDIKDIFGFKDLTITATPLTDTLTLVVDGRSERIRELGAGLSQFIIVLGNVATQETRNPRYRRAGVEPTLPCS